MTWHWISVPTLDVGVWDVGMGGRWVAQAPQQSKALKHLHWNSDGLSVFQNQCQMPNAKVNTPNLNNNSNDSSTNAAAPTTTTQLLCPNVPALASEARSGSSCGAFGHHRFATQAPRHATATASLRANGRHRSCLGRFHSHRFEVLDDLFECLYGVDRVVGVVGW